MSSNSFSAGSAWGDYNNDGLMDLFFANYTGTDYLFKNTGTTFLDITGGPLHDTGPGKGVSWGDFDNDGDLDLYVARYGQQDMLLRNDGGDVFTQITQGFPNTGGDHNSGMWADYDSDGDLDLYVAAEGANMLIRNDIDNGNHWLHVKPIGTMSNASAIGARVRIVSGGVAQIREITAGSGFMSQEAMRACFGLGANTIVDTLQVFWPSGTVQDTTNVAVDQFIYFTERDPLSAIGPEPDVPGNSIAKLQLHPCHPNPFNPRTTVSFDLPAAAQVSVEIHDARGRRVRSLFSGYKGAGNHQITWQGQSDNGRSLSSGVYFVTLLTEEHRMTQRVVLTK
jgi:ASPIC/UnbV protein/VCBS repeat protein/flagellar hook capping protein FlgD